MKQQLNILLVTNFVFDVVENFKYDEERKENDVKDGIKEITIYSKRTLKRSFKC